MDRCMFLLLKVMIGFVISIFLYYVIYKSGNVSMKVGLDRKIVNRRYSGLSCFDIEQEGLKDILSSNFVTETSIFFLEVTCKSINNGKILIGPRQACAVESAALANPLHDIYLLYTSPGLIKNEDSLSDRLLQILLRYKNVKIMHLNYKKLIENTPVETLYQTGKMQSAAFPVVVASDTARLLLLQKYGGIYLDLDVIVIKSLDNLSKNFIGIQSHTEAVNAVLGSSTDRNSSGLAFIQLCLEELQNHFDGSNWGTTGPPVVTNALKKLCNVDIVETLTKTDCRGFKVYPTEIFHPIGWQSWSVYFNGKHSQQQLEDILAHSYMIHYWNKMSSDFNASSVPNSIINLIGTKYCQHVFKEAGIHF